ncbi:MAG: universal stress protein [Candidatus Lokiarchaeia archaeon]
MVLKDRISRIHRLEELLGYAFKTLKKLYIPKIRSIVLPVGLTEESDLAIDFSFRLAKRFRSKIKVLGFKKLLEDKTREKVSECIRKLKKRGITKVERIIVEDFASEEIAKLIKGIPVEEVMVKRIKSFDLVVFPIPLTLDIEPYSSLEEKGTVYIDVIRSLVRKYANPVLLVKKTEYDEANVFGSVMVTIYNIDEIYSMIPIVLAVADPKAEIMLSYLIDEGFLESIRGTMHELSEEAVEVEWKIEELVKDKVDSKIEEIEPKIAEMGFNPFHVIAYGETISTLQTLADKNNMGLIVLTGYGAIKLMEPEIMKLALEINRPMLIMPSTSTREKSEIEHEEILHKKQESMEPPEEDKKID